MFSHRLFGLTTLILLLLGWSGCTDSPLALLPHSTCGPPLSDYSLYIGSIEGDYGDLTARILREEVITPKDLFPRYILNGRVVVEIEDISGRDLVKTRRETGRLVDTVVHDDFVNKDFTIKEAEYDLAALPTPYIERTASLFLYYTLNTPDGKPTAYGCKVGVDLKRKYGGLNQHLGEGHRVEDLPDQETTIRFLARSLAVKLAPLVNPDLAWRTEPLDDGVGFWGEPEMMDGVALAQAGQWDEAAVIWQNVLDQDPTHPSANYNLGLYHERLGGPDHLKKAYQYYAEAAKNGNEPYYRRALTRIFVTLRDQGIKMDEGGNDLEKLFK